MKVMRISDKKEGVSTQFNKAAYDHIFVEFDDGQSAPESVPIQNIAVWIGRKNSWYGFKDALKKQLMYINGAPNVHFCEP